MNAKLKYQLFTIIWAFILTVQILNAQSQITGHIVDANNKGVPYVAVTATQPADTNFITGTTASDKGFFKIAIAKPGTYKLQFSALGFLNFDTLLQITKAQIGQPVKLNKIQLNEGRTLEKVEIVGEKAQFQLGIDKKIFNPSQSLISKGGSALDALRQVPTVLVDINGNISVRGSESITIYINGRPSGLNAQNRSQILEQIPAENIERIEIITNPSARYDAEGMSGIINIVTKKKPREGIYGTVNAGVGTPFNKYNASASFSLRKGNFSTSNTLGFRYRSVWREIYRKREFYPNDSTYQLLEQSSTARSIRIAPTFTGNMGFDISKSDYLSFNYLFSYRRRLGPENNVYQFYNQQDSLTELNIRTVEEFSIDYSIDGGINYTHKFKKQRKLSMLASFSYEIDDDFGEYKQYNYAGTLEPIGDLSKPGLQNNHEDGISWTAVYQADYVHPFGKKNKYKIETGIKSTWRRFNNYIQLDSFRYDINSFVADSNITNRYIYTDDVNAAYFIFSAKFNKFGLQAGLRAEQTNVWGNQVTQNATFTKNYINFFPSVFLNYNFDKTFQIQLNYSRRIDRPGFWSLNPFTDREDPYNLRVGNPNLDPEIIESAELAVSKRWGKHYLYTSGYFRYIHRTIRRIQLIDSIGRSVSTFANVSPSMNYGLELVATNNWTKWFKTVFNANLFRSHINSLDSLNIPSQSNFSYRLRLQAEFKPVKLFSMQISGFYRGPRIIPQGRIEAVYGANIGVGFHLLKDNKLQITLNLSDVFNTRQYVIHTSGPDFKNTTRYDRESRILRLQVSYSFGNRDLFKKQRNQSQNYNQQGMDME